MQCLACRADSKMVLMDVLRDDTIKEPVIERRIYMCSACRHLARRLVFSRAQMPIIHLPVVPKSWPQGSEQDDKWSFCLTAGTLCPANQERQ